MQNFKTLIKSKKFWKICIPVLLVLAVVAVLLYNKYSVKPVNVTVTNVVKGDVKQYYETTGTISSSSQEKYYLFEGVKVKEVKVNPGDMVKKGDVLATFDTSSLDSIISEKKDAVNTAQKNYNNAIADKNDTVKRAADIDKRIADLKKQKKEIEKSNSEKPKENSSSSNSNTLSDSQVDSIVSAIKASGQELTPDQEKAIRAYFKNGQASSDLQAAQGALAALQNSTQSIDAQIQMLETERSMVNSGQYDAVIKAYKNNLDAAKESYDEAVAEKKALDEGWVATAKGKIGTVNIKAGKKYEYVADGAETSSLQSMLSGGSSFDVSEALSGMMSNGGNSAKKGLGLILDKYDGYEVTFSLGKYDAQVIRVGMPAILSYTDYEYEAEVNYKSPYAGAGNDLSAVMTGMMGGMSNSSGGNSSALKCTAKIKNPDDILIVGFDSKLSILTSEKENVLTIPVESLVIDEGKKYVFLYDEVNGKAVKTEVEVGISSDEFYEVTSGVSENDVIIVNSSKLKDGDAVKVEEK